MLPEHVYTKEDTDFRDWVQLQMSRSLLPSADDMRKVFSNRETVTSELMDYFDSPLSKLFEFRRYFALRNQSKSELIDVTILNWLQEQLPFLTTISPLAIKSLSTIASFQFTIDQWLEDTFGGYFVTMENFVRMVVIHSRLQANIPVVINGETGGGKTKTVEYLCRLRGDSFFVINVDGGLTTRDFPNHPTMQAALATCYRLKYFPILICCFLAIILIFILCRESKQLVALKIVELQEVLFFPDSYL